MWTAWQGNTHFCIKYDNDRFEFLLSSIVTWSMISYINVLLSTLLKSLKFWNVLNDCKLFYPSWFIIYRNTIWIHFICRNKNFFYKRGVLGLQKIDLKYRNVCQHQKETLIYLVGFEILQQNFVVITSYMQLKLLKVHGANFNSSHIIKRENYVLLTFIN